MNTTSLIESKMLYIRQWQSLPEFGVSHFVVRFRGSKKEVRYFNRGVGPRAQRLKSVVVLEFSVFPKKKTVFSWFGLSSF